MSSEDRIVALEHAVMTLAQQAADTAAITIAQGVIIRALAEGLAHGSSTSVGDVHDLALAMADYMPAEIATSVRALLAEAPTGSGARH